MDKKSYVTVQLGIVEFERDTDVIMESLIGKDKFQNDGWKPGDDDFVKGNS